MFNLLTMVGALAFAGGGIGYFTFPMGLEWGLKTFVNLKETGFVFPIYKAPPFSSKSQYWIYELKNPKDFLLGQKMKFRLRGPYVYTAYLYRTDVVFSNSEKLVAFHSHRTLYLDEKNSEDLDEKFWTMSPVVIGVQKAVKDMVIDKIPFKSVSEPIVFNAVNVLMDQYKMRLVVKSSARELLQGTKIELLESITQLAERFGVKSLLPPGPPENMFGISHAQNHTIDIQQIWTGVGDANRFAEVNTWRGKPKVEYWTGKCSIINGTNGELYKPFLKPGKPIRVFFGQLCRSFNLDPVAAETVLLKSGVEALEYEITPRLYQGARSNPGNKCFCKDTRTYDCQFDGLISMGPCYFDAPIYFARPNFKSAGRQIRGLLDEDTIEYPNIPEKQSFYLEPITGTIVRLNLTLVGTFKLVKQRYMRDLNRVQNLTYAPLFVAYESVDLPPEVAWLFLFLQKMYKYHKPGMFLMAVSGGAVLVMKYRKGRKLKAQPEAQSQPQTQSPPQAQPTQALSRENAPNQPEPE